MRKADGWENAFRSIDEKSCLECEQAILHCRRLLHPYMKKKWGFSVSAVRIQINIPSTQAHAVMLMARNPSEPLQMASSIK